MARAGGLRWVEWSSDSRAESGPEAGRQHSGAEGRSLGKFVTLQSGPESLCTVVREN